MTSITVTNKDVLENYKQAYNSRDYEAIEEVYADPFVYDESEVSVDDLLNVAEMWWTAFPDIAIDFEHVIAENELVATRERFHGTHAGEYQEIEPTGLEMDITYMVLYRVKSGSIVRVWSHFDTHGFNEQLGETGAELAGSVIGYLGK